MGAWEVMLGGGVLAFPTTGVWDGHWSVVREGRGRRSGDRLESRIALLSRVGPRESSKGRLRGGWEAEFSCPKGLPPVQRMAQTEENKLISAEH